MPDFERVFDKMRIDFAETPEDKARAEGFIEGKKFARKEILFVVIFFTVVWAIVKLGSTL